MRRTPCELRSRGCCGKPSQRARTTRYGCLSVSDTRTGMALGITGGSRMRSLVLVLVLLAGCDKVVQSELIESHPDKARMHCTHPGYCFTCTPGFDGKSHCGLKFSGICPGSR